MKSLLGQVVVYRGERVKREDRPADEIQREPGIQLPIQQHENAPEAQERDAETFDAAFHDVGLAIGSQNKYFDDSKNHPNGSAGRSTLSNEVARKGARLPSSTSKTVPVSAGVLPPGCRQICWRTVPFRSVSSAVSVVRKDSPSALRRIFDDTRRRPSGVPSRVVGEELVSRREVPAVHMPPGAQAQGPVR